MRKEVLIIGKSGVGKSSFINYLFDGKELCETGTGKPVTSEGVFRKEYMKDYYLYDTWGLEANKSREWTEMLGNCLNNIKKENIDLPIKGYFDAIFYCLSAKSARLEDAEKEIIDLLWREKHFPIIVLTKSDIASEDEKNALKDQLKMIDKDMRFVEVGSIEEETFAGKVESFGKECVEKLIYMNYINKLVNFVPAYLIEKTLQELEEQKKHIIKNIEDGEYDTDKYNIELRKVVEEIIPKKLNEELGKILELYGLNNLNIKAEDYSSASIGRAAAYTLIVILDFLTTPLLPLTIISGIVDYFTLKKRLKSHVEESFIKIEQDLKQLENHIKDNIVSKGSAIIICPNCNSKLKVSLAKKNKCPNCGNIEDIKNYY
ncbi:MAG: GTPase [Cetobacterium sp.]|uniref:GTPase n=1 Tax=Cetobacterium sp. TaxID=2071632 RepID=UPI003F2B8387